jgi:hypothetical protein
MLYMRKDDMFFPAKSVNKKFTSLVFLPGFQKGRDIKAS